MPRVLGPHTCDRLCTYTRYHLSPVSNPYYQSGELNEVRNFRVVLAELGEPIHSLILLEETWRNSGSQVHRNVSVANAIASFPNLYIWCAILIIISA